MKLVSYAATSEDLQCCAAAGVEEVLLEPATLAMRGTLSPATLAQSAQEAASLGLRPVVVWDRLMPERELRPLCTTLLSWDWTHIAAIRVRDVGAAWWLQQQFPTLPLQLDVEGTSHNRHALEGWCEIFQTTLQRLILSIELPEQTLISLCQMLPVECELLGAGPILLFTSPRSLLATPLQQAPPPPDAPLHATITSEKSNYRPFSLIESAHGTLMYLDKDQFILDRLEPLKQAGLAALRLDLRHLSKAPHAAQDIDAICTQLRTDPKALRNRWPRKTRAPFFKVNKTTAQFSKMKSPAHALRDRRCLAEVLAIKNGEYIVARALRHFQATQIQQLALPAGELLPWKAPLHPRDLQQRPLTSIQTDQVFLLDWHKKTCTGTLLLEAEAP